MIRKNAFSLPQPRQHMVEKFDGDKKASGLPCPVLSTLVNEGLLTPDANGEVTLDQLKGALSSIGVDRTTQKILAEGGARATESLERNVLNLLKLEGSDLDHAGSLGPLQDGGFNQVFLDRMKAFSSDGKSLTLDDLAAAQKARLIEDDAGLRDSAIGWAEVSALFLVFGRPNANGVKALSLADADKLFKENRLPEGFEPKEVGLLSVAWNAMKLALKQNIGSAGARAEKGLRDATEGQQRVDMSSMKGLMALCPTGGQPKGGMGVAPVEVGQLHQNLHDQTSQRAEG